MKDLLSQEIQAVEGNKLEEGVYHAIITDVNQIDDSRIKVRFDLTLDDNSKHIVYARINLKPKNTWDLINRLAQACRTRKPIEFKGKEVYVSVLINEPSSIEHYENIQDVYYYDDNEEEFEYQLTEKGYFFR